ncbi:hypothetical protein [Curtobacterium sp. MCLR17_054]|uniref:hypothetical protein n=1 Tax=Curtobacterium sp. MCLR17_054 TaxID=2175632 RepID=UPI000DA84A52|nr:hypothetical protein [Curtobacterium sp. MCLR17_054]WIE70320.1 hypothetical protein DEJ08_018280 [Curtobacterium sp. MCLR17_054]
MFKTKKSKVTAGVIAAALAVGAAGIGAVTTLNTTLTGNHLTAVAPDPTSPPTGGLVSISGAPLVKEFDGTEYNQLAESTWTLTNKGDKAAPFDGVLQQLKGSDPALADALTLQFGEQKGSDTVWHDAGTLADPVSYDEALSLDDSEALVPENDGTVTIPVRVVLADPTVLPYDGANPDKKFTLDANFVVNYTDPNTTSGK